MLDHSHPRALARLSGNQTENLFSPGVRVGWSSFVTIPPGSKTLESSMPANSVNPLKIEYLTVGVLKPYPRNARTHTRKQIHQIKQSISQFGFTNPILVDQENMVMAGHGRLEAAKALGLEKVPVIRFEHMSEAEKRAYILADNKLAENAGWDPEILKIELQNLSDLDLEFDLEITGFDTAEIELLTDGSTARKPESDHDQIPARRSPIVTSRTDLWTLGEHVVICEDARDPATYERLLGKERARVVFTDPPYNVPIEGHAGGLGAVKHPDFAMARGEMTDVEFKAFLRTTFKHLVAASIDGAIHYICMDWRHIEHVLDAAKGVYDELKNICVWNKDNGGMGSFYRSKHELVFVYKSGTEPHINAIDLGRSGRYRTNVWDYPGVNTMRAGRMDELSMHPTVKPVAMVIDALKDCSRKGDIVLDPFGGSGTTLIAAEKSRRRASIIEIDPGYVDVTIRRWEKLTGQSAIHAATGKTFSERAAAADEEKS
jgi:DNA modification methylase